jgi:hypothetical protein
VSAGADRVAGEMAAWPAILGSLLTVACAPPDQGGPHVVARGRYVEIATARGEPVCGGTAAHMDRIIEAAFAVMGETPPDHRFVRYEWLEPDDDPIGGAVTRHAKDGVLIRSDAYLVEEHELVHAAQLQSWPLPNEFLFEGHAVLLDAKRPWRDPFPWPEGESLDALLETTELSFDDYDLAWFLVSQIVLDHGFDGLRDFWQVVPRGSSAVEVRAAYQDLFGRPIDVLIEPYWIGDPEAPGSMHVDRLPCNYALCPDVESPDWQDMVWTAPGPRGCEDDTDAVGPDRREALLESGEVWREYLVSEASGHYYSSARSPQTASTSFVCALDCTYQGVGSVGVAPGVSTPSMLNFSTSPMRVEVRASLADLPTETPGTLSIVDEPPP